jgi:hypothetical protein
MRDTLHGDPAGLARAGWIVAGLSLTTAGYLAGGITAARERRRPPSLTPALAAGALVTTVGQVATAIPEESS